MLGQNIRAARKAAKITQEDLSKLIGVKRSVISRYENGNIDPPFSQIQAIADALLIPISALTDTGAYDAGFAAGSKAEEWQNHVIDELWRQEGYTGSEIEGHLIAAFSQLNPSGQQEAVKRVEELTEVPRYQKEKAPADGD